MKKLLAGAVALALTGAGTAAVTAQEPAPTVGLSIGKSQIAMTGADALKAGPTRIEAKASGGGERGFVLFQLKPGVTREEAEEEAPKIQDPNDAQKLGTFLAGGFVQGSQTYTTTVTLAGGEYIVLNFSSEQPKVGGGFTVAGEPNNAAPATPDATVGMRDYGFSGPKTLPRNGVIRVENRGDVLHHALAFPLRKGVNGKKVIRKIKRGKEPRSAFAGPPSALVEIVSPKTVNDVELKLRPGKTLLVCFLQDKRSDPPHASLGMTKIVTVR